MSIAFCKATSWTSILDADRECTPKSTGKRDVYNFLFLFSSFIFLWSAVLFWRWLGLARSYSWNAASKMSCCQVSDVLNISPCLWFLLFLLGNPFSAWWVFGVMLWSLAAWDWEVNPEPGCLSFLPSSFQVCQGFNPRSQMVFIMAWYSEVKSIMFSQGRGWH